jgi:DNA (cytosine-5)-methyltransferase 1
MKNSYITCTDQFCGAGGSSIGAVKAGLEVKLAMNHWKLAIETHNTNFPNTDHDCADISAVDPRRYRSTDILITSPECTNHSLAKGKPRRFYEQDLFGTALLDPADERSRATMWDVPRFAEFHDYRLIVVENVVDAARWRLWDSWLHAMHALGYDHEIVYLNSMFAHPTPQSRDRLYVVFWKRGNRKPNLDFRPASHCANCGKIVGAVQTWKKRVRWGRYKAQYFYRCPDCNQQVVPFYFAAFNAIDWSIPAERIGDRKKPLKPKTLERIRYGLETYGRQMMLITTSYGDETNRARAALESPTPTMVGQDKHGVVFPWLVETNHTGANGRYTNSSAYPLATQTTQQSLALIGFLNKQYGGQADPKHLSIGLDDPTGTVTTWDHHALLRLPAPFLVKTVRQESGDFGVGGLDAMPTRTTCQDMGLVSPAFIADMRGNSNASSLDEPLMCVTSTGSHHALVSAKAFLTYYYGHSNPSGMSDPIGTVTGLDRVGLVNVLDKLTVDDLTFRMLTAPEVGAAMAFPKTYKVLGTVRDQVKQYGNAVTPPAMEMLLERCIESLR